MGARWTPGLQRRHVDHKAVLHVAREHALVGPVDLLDADQLDVRRDAALAGVGLGYVIEEQVASLLQAGELVRVLED